MMNNNYKDKNSNDFKPKNSTSTTVGVIIILFGLFLLLRNLELGFLFPSWLFSWEVIFIIIGLVIGVNSKFEKKSSILLIAVGTIFLLGDIFDNFSPSKLIIPALAIIAGIYIINKSRNKVIPPLPPQTPPPHPTDEFDWDKRVVDVDSAIPDNDSPSFESSANGSQNHSQNYYNAENYLKLEAIFGSANKIIMSKNFIGGNITNIFASSEINLLQADINQPVVIDVFQLFGSVKIIVPPHWTVTHDISAILSETDDRRVILNHAFDQNKKIYITGTSIFSTLIIKNS